MVTGYLPSIVFLGDGLPAHWSVDSAGGYGTPSVSDGVIVFDWSVVPNNVTGSCGLIRSGDPADSTSTTLWEYNTRIPSGGGRIKFTITIEVGAREQVNLDWGVGDVAFRIRHGQFTMQQSMTSPTFTNYPWSGSCSYELWYPDGIDGAPRIDFDGYSVDLPGLLIDGGIYFDSGNASTTGPPGFPLPGPPDPKVGKAYISGMDIVAWDPTASLPFAYPWAVAVDGEWHGTYNLAAGSYYDPDLDQLVFDWSSTHPHRLGS